MEGQTTRMQRRRLKEPGWVAATSPFPVIEWKNDAKSLEFSCFIATNEGSKYGNAVFKIDVCLIPEFPRKSPSLRFNPPIFHSNVEKSSGAICWDATGPGWVASQVLHHIMEFDLPFLIDNPNHSDPHNLDAAELAGRDTAGYDAKCIESARVQAIRFCEKREDLFKPWTVADMVKAAGGRSFKQVTRVELPRPHLRRRAEAQAAAAAAGAAAGGGTGK